MSSDEWVSVIMPCYNGEKFLKKTINSVLQQSYKKIQFIFVNDGSTDKTQEIILGYEDDFKLNGMDFIYLIQKNKGQAAALNYGLRVFTGDYLMWTDSDDILHKDNIKEKVNFLQNKQDYQMVLSDSVFIDINYKVIGKKRNVGDIDNIFHNLLTREIYCFAGGSYLIRSSYFLQINPQKQIYESRGGQNWQMLLPLLYNTKCGYIEKTLYYILKRHDSHSRKLNSREEKIERHRQHKDILINTIKSIDAMPNHNKINYINLVVKKYNQL